jgi:diacylglycerol kinase (ATP)
MKPGKTGLNRIYHATRYSFLGLRSAWNVEAAFRQEVVLFLILTPCLFLIPLELAEKLLMFISLIGLLIVELLNSAIEAVVDRISLAHHELSGRAKDIASASVFLAIVQFIVIWSAVLWPW